MDFTVRTTDFQVENRGWLRGPHGTGPGDNPSIVLDLSKFTKATHYPKGYIPSGVVVGKMTAGGLYGPYDPAATDGRQVAKGILFGSESVADGQTRASNALFVHGFADASRLPLQSGTGSLDAAAKTALNLIYWD